MRFLQTHHPAHGEADSKARYRYYKADPTQYYRVWYFDSSVHVFLQKVRNASIAHRCSNNQDTFDNNCKNTCYIEDTIYIYILHFSKNLHYRMSEIYANFYISFCFFIFLTIFLTISTTLVNYWLY